MTTLDRSDPDSKVVGKLENDPAPSHNEILRNS